MKITVAAVLTAACLASAVPAHAAVYTTSYTGTVGAAATASFTIITSDALNSRGGYNILNVTGNVNGENITSLIANPNQPDRATLIGRWHYDNVYYNAARLFDSDGVSFTTETGAQFNLWGNSTTSYGLYGVLANPTAQGTWITSLNSSGYMGSVVSPPPPPPPAHPSPNPVVLTFEEVIAGAAEVPVYSSPLVSTQGYQFAMVGPTPETWVQYLSPPTTEHGEKGLQYMIAPTLMTAVDGSLFDVTSLDAATGDQWYSGDTSMVLTGTRSNGSHIEATLGIGLAFRTFALVGFTNLVSLQFSKPLFSGHLGIDNIAVGPSAVPEPATWAMMIIGFGMIGGGARYRQRGAKVAVA